MVESEANGLHRLRVWVFPLGCELRPEKQQAGGVGAVPVQCRPLDEKEGGETRSEVKRLAA